MTKPKKTLTFREYILAVRPGYSFLPFNEKLISILQRVAEGEITRLMIFMPPRHGKSELVSRLFSAYYLYRYPERFVGLCSYAAELAYTLSRAAKANFERMGGLVSGKAAAVKHWETTQGGGLWAAGVGGAIAGKGFHMGIIDDPLKNAEEAASEKIREKQKDWYASTFYTREEQNSALIVLTTRWHEDDLAGWLLSEEANSEDDERENWHVVSLPAIAEPLQEFPPNCTVEPDFREPGEALWPEKRSVKKLKLISRRIGEYFFGALFQQRPTAKEGSFFKVSKLEIIKTAPIDLVRIIRAWDFGASDAKGDFTTGFKIGVDRKGLYYVLDVVRGQWSSDDRNDVIKQTAALDGPKVTITIPQDPGQAGKSQAESMTRMLAGYVVKVIIPSGKKEVRADFYSAQVNVGNVKLVEGVWNRAYIEELRQFPRGKFDDQVDASSDGFNTITRGGVGVYV